MTLLLIHGALALIILSAFITRFGLRRAAAARRALETEERELSTIGLAVEDTARTLMNAQERLSALDAREDEAREALDAAERQLATAKATPAERYYIFDRQDPRPGTLWEVPVTRTGEATQLHRMAGVWGERRLYLVVAATRREAEDRVGQRYPRAYGFAVAPPRPCPLFDSSPATAGKPDRHA